VVTRFSTTSPSLLVGTKQAVVLLLGCVLVVVGAACGGTQQPAPAPSIDIEATVEARFQKKLAEDAALEAKAQAMAKVMVEATVQAAPTVTPTPPTSTPVPPTAANVA